MSAIREYRRVADRIPDARASVAYFVRQEIALPDCTTLKPGARAEVELCYRNIAECDVKVYRIDLMKFCEAGQALGDMSQVSLSGIRPLSETKVALSGSGDFADRAQKLALPLKREGAYLVVCRGNDLYASGLLLISRLEIEQRLDAASNQVRVFVKDSTTGRCAGEVQVKLLPRGANVQAIVAGTTDLRGIFMADAPAGGAAIVARGGPGQYAYIAAPPLAAAPQGNVAQARLPDIDPTAPYATTGFEELERTIRETARTKSGIDNGSSGHAERVSYVPFPGSAARRRRECGHLTAGIGRTPASSARAKLAYAPRRRGIDKRKEHSRGTGGAGRDRLRRYTVKGRRRAN